MRAFGISGPQRQREAQPHPRVQAERKGEWILRAHFKKVNFVFQSDNNTMAVAAVPSHPDLMGFVPQSQPNSKLFMSTYLHFPQAHKGMDTEQRAGARKGLGKAERLWSQQRAPRKGSRGASGPAVAGQASALGGGARMLREMDD